MSECVKDSCENESNGALYCSWTCFTEDDKTGEQLKTL